MKKVLAVDDSEVVRTIVALHLRNFGCQVTQAADGREGVELARREKPDLILMDVSMPVMDGAEALATLRGDPVTRDIPVIMITAETTKERVMELARLGVSGYIVKPFNRTTFSKEVGKVLGTPASAEAPDATPVPDAPAAADAPVDRGCVLVVDDSQRVLDVARATLEKSLTVLTAASGSEAIARWAEKRPAVVVIDLAMPDMDGFATLAGLRQVGGQQSHCIALAVRGDTDARQRARQAGFASVVEKPIQPEVLLDQVTAAAGTAKEDSIEALVSEHEGFPVLAIPDSRGRLFARFVLQAHRTLRELAEEGNDRLIVDLADVGEVTTGLAKALAQLISLAASLGIRAAVCAPDKVATNLRQISETRGALFVPSRAGAMEALR